MMHRAALTLLLATAVSAPLRSAEVCAWLVESNQPNDVRQLVLWLEADSDAGFNYQIGGKGLVTEQGHTNAPNSGFVSLDPRTPKSPWKIGATFVPPGQIDVTLALRRRTDSLSDPPGPEIARYNFVRDVPESETTPPWTLAGRQCKMIPPAAPD